MTFSIMNRTLLVSIALISGLSASAQKLNCRERKALKQVRADITYLASDELMGRATGTEGEHMSAYYIADAFKRNKLEPKGNDGYFQKFTITTLRIADGKSQFALNGENFRLFKDYYPLSYSSNGGEFDGGAVDAGFGIASDKRNDYEGKDVEGKAVLINIGSPDGIHPHSAYLAWHGLSVRVDEAVKRGAKAVFFYRANEKVEKPKGELSLTMEPSSVPVIFIDRVLEDVDYFKSIDLSLKVLVDQDTAYNVVGFKDNGAEHTVIIGAHHDHLGMGQHGNSLAKNTNEIHNGADDNASGTSGLIVLSKWLKKSKKWNKNNNYLFIAFSGEEMGLLGSKYFVKHPTIDLNTANYMLNMDMIGVLTQEKALIVNGVGTSPIFESMLDSMVKEDSRIAKLETTKSGIGPSDHTSFYLQKMPVMHFFTGAHEHYHKPSDDVEIVNDSGVVYVLSVMRDVIARLNTEGKLEYVKTKDETKQSRRMKFEVTLGVVPNYSYDGEGMELDAVREGKPGQAAGLKAKDVIVSFGGKNIKNIQDYMAVLGELKKGSQTTVVVRRDGELVTLNVQF